MMDGPKSPYCINCNDYLLFGSANIGSICQDCDVGPYCPSCFDNHGGSIVCAEIRQDIRQKLEDKVKNLRMCVARCSLRKKAEKELYRLREVINNSNFITAAAVLRWKRHCQSQIDILTAILDADYEED